MARSKKKTMAGKDTIRKVRKKTPPPTASSSKASSDMSKSTAKPTKPAQSAKRVSSTAKTTEASTKAPKKPRGNPGNFHGEPLSVLESWWEAYFATTGWKQAFWKDFLKEWDEKFPAVNKDDDSDNAHLDADPDVHFARRAPLAVRYPDFLQNILSKQLYFLDSKALVFD